VTILTRPATPDDLAAIWDIRYLNDVADETHLPPRGDVPPYLMHVLRHGTLLVTDSPGSVSAYGGAIERGGIVYLTDLFVHPEQQSEGIGQSLLNSLFKGVEPARRCTLASVDPRAIALYTRFGMAPVWPNMLLERETTALRIDPATRLELEPVAVDDPALIAFDARVSGRTRPKDLIYWRDRECGSMYWVRREDQQIGFAVVRTGAGRLWHPETVTIGPCGAEPEHAAATVLAAVAHAADLGDYLEIAVPGPHSVLPHLLNAGFRIVYVETACLGDASLIHPRAYVGSGGDLF